MILSKKNVNSKKRNLRSNKKNDNGNTKKNLFGNIYENEDIIINDSNIDKCQNFISVKTNELIIMQNYPMNYFIPNNFERNSYYEYNLEIIIVKNNKNNNNNNYNNIENIPRIFKVYMLETGDDHLIYNYIYNYLELFTEKEKTNKKKVNKTENDNIYNSKKLNYSSSGKNKSKKIIMNYSAI